MNHNSAKTLLGCALVLVSSAALAQALGTPTSSAACCSLTTSLANDAIRGNDIAGDERFFMTDGAPPNIHFLIDTSGSMKELPQVKKGDHRTFFNSTVTVDATSPASVANFDGCNNSFLMQEQTRRSWDPTRVYPIVDVGTGFGSDNGKPNLFQDSKFYSYMSWGDSENPATRPEIGAPAMCQALHPDFLTTGVLPYNRCLTCLQTRGFYKPPAATMTTGTDETQWGSFVFSGRFMNFNPPKYAILKVTLKSVIASLRRVRAGYSSFANAGDGAVIGREQNPSCSQIISDSSSFDSNRGSYINDVDGFRFNTNTPLAESLYNIGQYFSSDDSIYTSKYGMPAGSLKPGFRNGSLTSQGRSWCWGCQVSSVVILTDGQPTTDNWEGGNSPRAALQAVNGGDVTCPSGACAAAESARSNDLLDDVAKFLATKDLQDTTPTTIGDLNTAGSQSMNIYGVIIGNSSPILRNATEGVGGGAYFEARDTQELKQYILDILAAVQTRSTAFAAASVASLQVNRTGGSLLPRFKPSKRGSKAAWQGYLYRFDLGQEALMGCDPVVAKTLLTGGAGDANDANRDGDCSDVVLLDRDGDGIVEDDQGNFKKIRNPLLDAKPYWEFGSVLKPALADTQKWMTRKIWTITDSNNDNRIDKQDQPIEFIESNSGQLRDYLGISNNVNECSALAVTLGLASMTPDECAKTVIRYYRGADVLNSDPARRVFDRPFLLNDIFHSAPVVVEPLADTFMCGFGNQCLQTLGNQGANKTPMFPETSATTKNAYDKAVATLGTRDKIIIVGSNGGLLHAIHNGKKTTKDPDSGLWNYDAGTGQELWAFIPPDLLPKLKPNMGKHAYMVDGTAMVRDVWLDGAGGDPKDGIKNEREFRTVAIVGEGRGGSHRFALDLTRLIGEAGAGGRAHQPPDSRGDFLWVWPQPCDEEALMVGDATGNFAPKPPAIGPVAIKNSSGPYKVNSIQAEERWVAFFNGGYDQYLMRGRMLAMVDIASGKTLWRFSHADGSPNSDKLNFPVEAPVAMIDMGNANSSTADKDFLFDTATVGDYGGNVWTVRFWQPGELNPVTGRIGNWFAARSFRANPTEARIIQPIAQMTSNTLQPDTGFLRTFIGTGDRQNIMDLRAPVCRLSNPMGCAQQGCAVNNTINVMRGGVTTRAMAAAYSAGNYNAAGDTTVTAPPGPMCQSAGISLHFSVAAGGNCTTNVVGDEAFLCDGGVAAWDCRQTLDTWTTFTNASPDVNPRPASPDRFFGFWSYGVQPARIFNNALEAAAFDATRLNEAMLVDVTTATINATGTASVSAGTGGRGWFFRYTPTDERQGSSSTIIDGCVLWNSFEPTGNIAVCSTTGSNLARLYQGQYTSGAPSCAKTFFNSGTQTWSRSITRTVVAVPGEPSPQRFVYKGLGGTSAVTMEAGRSQGDTVNEAKEILKAVFQIPVDRAAHDCRHEGVGCE